MLEDSLASTSTCGEGAASTASTANTGIMGGRSITRLCQTSFVDLDGHDINGSRQPETNRGFYESWFLRANHPFEPRAFWIRYTIFQPADNRPALGELWAIVFDNGEITARKREFPLQGCSFDRDALRVRIGDATLEQGTADGAIEDLRWALQFDAPHPPVLMLPADMYRFGFPKAKLLTPAPLSSFRGTIDLGDRTLFVADWIGSQNHNWGSQHTDRYAWGQVAGFDGAPEVFFEAATAWLKLGPLTTPPLTLATLRMGDRTLHRIGLRRSALTRATLDKFVWTFRGRHSGFEIEAHFEADPSDFVALRYLNPPGGHKACLNTKVARCTVTLRGHGEDRTFETRNRAAFEVLQDDHPPDMPLLF